MIFRISTASRSACLPWVTQFVLCKYEPTQITASKDQAIGSLFHFFGCPPIIEMCLILCHLSQLISLGV